MRRIDKFNLNKKKKIIISVLILAFIGIIVCISLYIAEKNVRDWIDIYIFRKNTTENDSSIINLNIDKSNQICVYSKYIAILNDKIISLYNSYGEKVTNIDVNINTALFDSSDKYLAIAENHGHEVCLLLEKTYLWSEEIEGEILQVHVNQNGFVAIISTDVTHKSILTMYNSEGKKLFTSYFSATRIIDASISSDNKYIAIGELDSSGTVVKSNVKIISVKNAQDDPENTIIYTYKAESDKLITNVEYQDKGQIACIFDSEIRSIKDEDNKQIIKLDNENITFITNNLKKHIVYIQEESEGLFKSASNIHIINTNDNHEIVYKLDDIAKNMYSNDNIIAINAGTDLYFINTSRMVGKEVYSKAGNYKYTIFTKLVCSYI